MYELYVPYIMCPECDMLGSARATSDAEATGSKPVQDIEKSVFFLFLIWVGTLVIIRPTIETTAHRVGIIFR